jgi:5-methylcytosine-specific restriction endonuclease McrA
VSLVESPDIQSPAALLLLSKDLIKLDKTIGYRVWLDFRDKYLGEVLERDGLLRCGYCNKGHLIIDTEDKSVLATIDHIHPLSKGGSEFGYDNLLVACYTCNHKKNDSILSELI